MTHVDEQTVLITESTDGLGNATLAEIARDTGNLKGRGYGIDSRKTIGLSPEAALG